MILAPRESRTRCRLGDLAIPVEFVELTLGDGVKAVLVDVPELFDRDGLYGSRGRDFPDNALRFAVLSRAALEYARLKGTRISVIHAHDWQTGLVPVYQKMHFADDPVVGGVPLCLHDSQPCVPGRLPAGRAAADRPRTRDAPSRGAGVLGSDQFSQGGRQLQRKDHDRQPDLRARDPHAGLRLRHGRRAAEAGRRPRRAFSTASTPCGGIRRRTSSCRRFNADDLSGKQEAQPRAARGDRSHRPVARNGTVPSSASSLA